MATRAAIEITTIEELRTKMNAAPEVTKVAGSINKQEAIRLLKNEIEELQKKGYSIDGIAKFFSDGGVPISTPTLKSYLHRTKPVDTKIEKKTGAVKAKKETSKVASKDTIKVAKIDDENKQVTPDKKGSFEVSPDSDI
jgi:hypothetical protein